MGNKITKENSNGQTIIKGNDNNLFKDNLKKYIYEINNYENLKRGCCLRDDDGDFNISIPLINDDNKTYSTIEIQGRGNENTCKFNDNGNLDINGYLYNPSTLKQEDTFCKAFYTNFCDNVYDTRHLDGHIETSRNYTNNKKLTWYSDCNCINSTISSIDRKTKTGHKISPLDLDSYPNELRMPNVFDTFCRDGDNYLTKPFRRQKDYEDSGKSITVCSQTIKLDEAKIGRDLKLNNVNFKMACSGDKNISNSGEKQTKGPTKTDTQIKNIDSSTQNKQKNDLEKSGSDILSKINENDDNYDPNIENIEKKVQNIIDNIKKSSTEKDFNNIKYEINNTIDEINNLPNKNKYISIINDLENMKKNLQTKENNYIQNIMNTYNISNMHLIFSFFIIIFIFIGLFYLFSNNTNRY